MFTSFYEHLEPYGGPFQTLFCKHVPEGISGVNLETMLKNHEVSGRLINSQIVVLACRPCMEDVKALCAKSRGN